MKKMKKILAMLMALTMGLGMTMTASAETTVINPSDNDVETIAVTGLPEENAVVTAYQIVDAQYATITGTSTTKFEKYVAVEITATEDDETKTLTVAVPEAPTVAEVTDIATAIEKNIVNETLTSASLEWDSEDEVYSADVGAGYWVVLVDPIDLEVYNPMLAGVYYLNTDGNGNKIEGTEDEPINADGNWVLNGTMAHVKSSDTNFDKKIVDAGSGLEDGDDVKYEDTITYELTTKIPAYSAAYKDVTFTITDTLLNGIDFVPTKVNEESVEAIVNVNGSNINEDAIETYEMTIVANVLTIDFTDKFIKAHGGENVVITYNAKINANATFDEDENMNSAKLVFTNDPSETTDFREDSTNHYTFDFGIIKVNDKEGNDRETLAGAEFELSQNDEVIRTEVSAEGTGLVSFKGLDEGEYTFVETKAPDGYQLDTTVHTVEIAADYNEEGTLTSYTITVDGNVIESYGLTDEDGNALEKVETTLDIKNTQLIALPSTGGIGTTIFTVAGCGIMIAAAFFFFASRKKENE